MSNWNEWLNLRGNCLAHISSNILKFWSFFSMFLILKFSFVAYYEDFVYKYKFKEKHIYWSLNNRGNTVFRVFVLLKSNAYEIKQNLFG